MSAVTIYKAEDGKLAGFGEKGSRAYAKFKRVIDAMEIGETLGFAYRLPRSPKHHAYFFKKLHALFDRQESFADFDRLLDFLKVGSGHVDMLPSQNGVLVAVPKSINWESMEEQEFIEFHKAMNDFLWQDYAQVALWPHLDASQRYRCIDGWHREFEQPTSRKT